MEFTKAEILVVEEVVAIVEAQVRDLSDFQLALVGGGSGDIIHG